MRLYRALGIPSTATDKQISESYQSTVRKTASTADMSAADESYLILLDERKRYLYDLFGDTIVDILRDNQASFCLVGALDPTNIVLLVVIYSMILINLILLPLLILTRPYYQLSYKLIGAPTVLALLLLSIAASNTYLNWAKRRNYKNRASWCLGVSISSLVMAIGLFFILVHFDDDMGIFRCLLLLPFVICEIIHLRMELGVATPRIVVTISLSLLRGLLAFFVFMWTDTALICIAFLLNIAAYGYCKEVSAVLVVAMAIIPILYVYGILLLVYEQRYLLALTNCIFLTIIAVFDTKILKFMFLMIARSDLKQYLSV